MTLFCGHSHLVFGLRRKKFGHWQTPGRLSADFFLLSILFVILRKYFSSFFLHAERRQMFEESQVNTVRANFVYHAHAVSGDVERFHLCVTEAHVVFRRN